MTTRRLALVLSLAIGMIAIVGVFAASRTIGLGTGAHSATDAQIARRTAVLDRYAASLRSTLARNTQPLPAGSSVRAATPTGGQPVRVVYHRPPPIVIHTHRSGGEDVAEGSGIDD